MILGIDTSSALTSVALVDDGVLLAERRHLDARRHAEVLAPLLAELLGGVDAARISAVACGVGPGPYTGLRVGIATALALGAAWDIPVHGLCSLDAVAAAAQSARPGQPVAVAVDARRAEVYWAAYAADGLRVAGPHVGPAEEAGADAVVALPEAAWVARCVESLLAEGATSTELDVPLDTHGEDSGATAHALAGARLLPPRPLYLRRPDAVASRP